MKTLQEKIAKSYIYVNGMIVNSRDYPWQPRPFRECMDVRLLAYLLCNNYAFDDRNIKPVINWDWNWNSVE